MLLVDMHLLTHLPHPPPPNRSKNYEIRTGFPPRAYNDLNQTLQDAGLVPNATLFLKATTN